MSKKIPVYAWYFPNWHPDPRNEGWHGKGWTEWEVVKHARPRFEGHDQPHVPLWGYEDESDPKVMEKKIDTALTHGVDGFLWDFYWFEDGPYRLKALEQGFFGAANNKKCKIALMWCNHDPVYWHPMSYRNASEMLLDGTLSVQAFYNGTQYMIENCFNRENYLRVNGKLVFILWDPIKLVKGFGGLAGARIVLDDFRRRVCDAGLGELNILTEPTHVPGFRQNDREGANAYMRALGIDGGVHYCWAWRNDAFPVQPFETYMEDGLDSFAHNTRMCDVPMNITVSTGWDNSPRTVQSDMYDRDHSHFLTMVTGGTPEKFKYMLQQAKAFYESDRFTGDFISLSTWNEWTEGNFLEPSVKDGYGYLEAVRDVFGTKDNPK